MVVNGGHVRTTHTYTHISRALWDPLGGGGLAIRPLRMQTSFHSLFRPQLSFQKRRIVRCTFLGFQIKMRFSALQNRCSEPCVQVIGMKESEEMRIVISLLLMSPIQVAMGTAITVRGGGWLRRALPRYQRVFFQKGAS